MNQSQSEGGIKFDNKIRITSDGKRNLGFTLFFQTLFILLGVIGIIYSWIEGLSLGVNHEVFILGIVITVLVNVGLNEIRRYQGLFFLLYFAFIAGIVHHYWEYIKNGFYCLENAVIEKAAVYYGLNPVRFVVELEPEKSLTIILLLVVQAVVLVTALEVYKHYMRSVYLFCILFFYGGLLALGMTPPGSFMLLTLLAFLGFRTMDHIPGSYHKFNFFKRDNYHEVAGSGKQILRIKAALVIISCILVSFLLVRVVVTKDYYDKNMDMKDQKVKLQKAIKEFSVADVVENIKDDWNDINPFSGDESDFSGGLDSGKIGDVGEVEFTGDTALNVTMDKDVTYEYLKGFAGCRYETVEWADLSKSEKNEYQKIVERYGDGKYSGETLLWEWLTLEETSSFSARDLTYDIPEGTDKEVIPGDVKVNYVNANEEFLYAPYVSNYQDLGELNSIGDQYFAPNEEKSDYLFMDSYLPYNQNLSLDQMLNLVDMYLHNREFVDSPEYDSFMQFEEAYRRFVYETYTQLPSQGLERLRSVQLNDEGDGIERTMNVVESVISYLHENTNYSLTPGVPKKGVDFAEYFLFDKKEGYCSHYATAAVLLLRNYHIPARYVEGYVVTNQDIQQAIAVNGMKSVDVRDYNAHAWVEVYFDGIGWIPVEVTKGYSEQGVSNLIPEIKKESEKIESEKKPATPTVKPKPTITPTKRPKVTKAPSIGPTKTPGPGGITSGKMTNSTSSMWRSLGLLLMTCILGAFLLFFSHYLVKRNKKLKHLTKGLPNNQGIYSYGLIEKLLLDQGILKNESMSYEEFAQYAKESCSLLPPQFDEIIELALKAKFSKEGITKEEADHLRNYYSMFYSKVYQSKKKGKRLFLKYWKVY